MCVEGEEPWLSGYRKKQREQKGKKKEKGGRNGSGQLVFLLFLKRQTVFCHSLSFLSYLIIIIIILDIRTDLKVARSTREASAKLAVTRSAPESSSGGEP